MRIKRASLVLVFLLTVLPATSSAQVPELPSINGDCYESAKGYKCFYGPFKYSDVEEHGDLIFSGFVRPPDASGYITSMRATLVDSDGGFVPRHAVHLHHAVWLNTRKPDMTCDNFLAPDALPYLPDRFFATGKERTKIELPAGYGYHWDNQKIDGYPFLAPVWYMNTHLHWMHGDEPDEVTIRLNLGFTHDDEADGMTDIRPVWFDVDNCSDSEFDVPGPKDPGHNYKRTWDWTMPEGGRFVTLGGHLHDGGRRLTLFNRTTDQMVYVSRATYGTKDPADSSWDLRKMSTYSADPGIDVSAGDTLRLTAVYDHSKNWKDVMGIMIGALVVDP